MATLNGTDLGDSIVGTSGADTIVSGKGNDTVRGDSGAVDNLLVDGSFETANVAGNTWTHFQSVGGWQSDTGVEVWGKNFISTASDGDKLMELDFDNRQSNVWQDVQTSEGETYTFSFDYAQRPGTAAATNTIEVWWNGEKVGEVDPSSTGWEQAEFSVVGTGGTDRVEFRESAGDNNSLGGLIDNVKLFVSNQSDTIDGGAGNDVLEGNGDDDLMLGGGGDDTMSGGDGNDHMFGSSSLGGAVDMDAFRISESVAGTVTFMGESAGYQNALGMYKIGADGSIRDVEILFANASLAGSGGDLVSGRSAVDIKLEAGDRIAFFVVPNAYAQSGMATLLSDDTAGFMLVDADGNAGNVNGGPLKLVHVAADGAVTDVRSQYGGELFHSVMGEAGRLNGDGLEHVKGKVDVADGSVTIGFEDLWNGGDKDYDDSVFKLDIGVTNAALLVREGSGDGKSSDKDVMTGDVGDDRMFGMADDDLIEGGDGNDALWGNSGNDIILGGDGADTVNGGSGNDVQKGGDGDDVMNGNSGDDVLDGGAGNDDLKGTSGNDTIYGGVGDDTISGGSDDDVIADGDGNDSVAGNAGDDVFHMGEGDDDVRGGSGFDTLVFTAAREGVEINLSGDRATGMGNDTFNSIEAVIGSDFNDVMVGSTKDNVLSGGDGDDLLRGGRGDDTMAGGAGDDTFVYLKSDVVLRGEHVGVDVISDFGNGSDVLDLSDLLQHEAWGSIDEVLSVRDNGSDTVVYANIGGDVVQLAVLEDFSGYSASDMVRDGMILV